MSLNSSYAPPGETSADIWVEVSRLIGETVLCGFSFGILTTLYILTIDALFTHFKRPTHRRWALIHIVYGTLLLFLTGAGTASDARAAQLVWINNRNYPKGGVLGFIGAEQNLKEYVWGWAVYVIASWLQDGYVIYRCLMFWEWNYWVCGLPILCFFASMATSIALLVETALPGQGLYGKLTIDFATCWYVFSVSINVLATLLILLRLYLKRDCIGSMRKGEAKKYIGLVSVLVESAALYSVVGIIFIGCYFRQNPVGGLILPMLGNLEGICPLMIIYRVAIGRGWTYETFQQLNSTADVQGTHTQTNHRLDYSGREEEEGEEEDTDMSKDIPLKDIDTRSGTGTNGSSGIA